MRSKGADELIKRLQQPNFRSARLAQMIRNPLLLANLCLVHRDRNRQLPKARHKLYEECIYYLPSNSNDFVGFRLMCDSTSA